MLEPDATGMMPLPTLTDTSESNPQAELAQLREIMFGPDKTAIATQIAAIEARIAAIEARIVAIEHRLDEGLATLQGQQGQLATRIDTGLQALTEAINTTTTDTQAIRMTLAEALGQLAATLVSRTDHPITSEDPTPSAHTADLTIGG